MSSYFYYKGSWILKRLGVLPATSADKYGQGFVNKTADFLKSLDSFYLLISPEGSLDKNPWRSGYYALAKSLECPIVVAGADYERKYVYLGNPHPCTKDTLRKEIEPILQEEMKEIVPLYPECSFTPVRPHDIKELSMFNWDRIIMVLLVLSALFLDKIGYILTYSLMASIYSVSPFLSILMIVSRIYGYIPYLIILISFLVEIWRHGNFNILQMAWCLYCI